MDIESARFYCLSLPLVTEDMPFGEGVLIFRIFGKIFAALNLEGEPYLTLKCDPDYAVELRERYADIDPAYHWNKKFWNQHRLRGSLHDDLIQSLIRHAYAQVVAKLTKKIRTAHPEITLINS